MSRLSRLIVVVMLLLCLPLQGLAAIAMPIGMNHAEAMVMNTAAMEDMANHCDQHANKAQPESPETACDQCFTCHISIAQALVPSASGLPMLVSALAVSVVATDKLPTLTFPFYRPPILA